MKSPDEAILKQLEVLIKGYSPTCVGMSDCSPAGFYVAKEQIVAVCQALRDESVAFFDYLACLTGIDYGPEVEKMEVLYHLYSMGHEHGLTLSVEISRKDPSVPSVSAVWRGANWLEREVYDLFGIYFEGHPDLRRILLPEDWEGHPLRKDYQSPDTYQGIRIAY